MDNYKIDFEDTLQYYSALSEKCDYIITKDLKDLRRIKKFCPSDIKIVKNLKGIN